MNKQRYFALFLITIGIFFFLKEPIKNYFIKEVATFDSLSTYTTTTIKENQQLDANFAFDQTAPVSWESVLESYKQRDDLPVIGGMAIPSLNLWLPILKGLSEANLFAGAGTMTPSQQLGEGNYSLASHNVAQSGVLFSDIQDLTVGEHVYLTDLEYIYVYQIDLVEMVSPTRTDVINEVPGKISLTLVTCSDDLLNRWICQGNLVEKVDVANASSEMLEMVKIK